MEGDLFYPLSIIIVAVFLSIYKTFDTKKEEIDYYQQHLIKIYIEKYYGIFLK